MIEAILRGGRVIDGTGAPATVADVAIGGGRIVEIGNLSHLSAPAEIDAGGAVVAPGFIDMHAHDDFNLPVNPYAEGKISQGVTTVVNGNCGYSPAPCDPDRLALHREIVLNIDSGLDFGWASMGEFLDRHPDCGVNVCQLVGHNAVRAAVMGVEARPPTEAELDAMRAHVDEAMRAGAIGFSTGLFGPPSGNADIGEVVELARVAARHGGSYHTHMRNEGSQVAEAIDEALEVGRRSGAAVQISHLKISNPDHHGIADRLLARIRSARDEGIDVHCDQYPYRASSGGLRARLPAWAQTGTRDEVLSRLADPQTRARLRNEIEEGMARDGVSMRIYDFADVLVAVSPSRPHYVGLSLAEVAVQESKPPAVAMIDLLLDDLLATRGIYFHMSEVDVRRILADPLVAIGSDGLYMGMPGKPDTTNPHPRHYGTFARVLGHYTRDERLLDLPEAVRKMTGLSADILGLKDRGRIAPGMRADIVIFDPEAIRDRATFEAPHQTAAGIVDVLLDGVAVMRNGAPTGATPGRVLRPRRTT